MEVDFATDSNIYLVLTTATTGYVAWMYAGWDDIDKLCHIGFIRYLDGKMEYGLHDWVEESGILIEKQIHDIEDYVLFLKRMYEK